MKYKQNFRVPAQTLKAWNGSDYQVQQGSTSASFEARHVQQAFRIGKSIAQKNGWLVSGQPVKLGV